MHTGIDNIAGNTLAAVASRNALLMSEAGCVDSVRSIVNISCESLGLVGRVRSKAVTRRERSHSIKTTFDPMDNIEVREALEAKYEYGYDDVDRLTSVDTILTGQATASNKTYGYDPVGNRTTDDQSTWVYDDNDRLQQRGEFTYEYDANGSRTKQTNTTSGEIRNYSYNLENRLSEIRDETSNLIASYNYDPFGRRISKTVSGITTYYYYSDQGLIAEADGIGNVTTTYGYQMNTPWGTDPMFIKQGGQYGYYVTDHLGTPQVVVGGNGLVLWEGVYDVFGEIDITTALITSNLRFPGQYFDGETGLHYNYWRYYDASIGRYVSSDPIGLVGGINTYGYVEGNPLSKIDSKGLNLGVLPAAAVAICSRFPAACVAAAGYVACKVVGGCEIPIPDGDADPNQYMPAPGNVGDTGIEADYGEAASDARLCGNEPPDRCDWLKKQGGKYSKKRTKAQEKKWGCRKKRS